MPVLSVGSVSVSQCLAAKELAVPSLVRQYTLGDVVKEIICEDHSYDWQVEPHVLDAH